MTRRVVTVGREARFKRIVRLMQERQVSALPVLEGMGRVVGVVSEADLLPKEEFRERFRDSDPDLPRSRLRSTGGTPVTQMRRLSDPAKAGAVTAGELMTSPALTVRADTTLAEAAQIMATVQVRRLPVVDGQDLLQGIVSRTDLLKVFLRDDEDIARQVRREIVSYLFPSPPSAVRVVVRDGIVTLTGSIPDRSLVPAAARLARAVEGVVDVRFELALP
ncbi:CBS domain-containing protein [Streptomyces poonensis]|nr:CBS domain-containing protein [Streptomyces poonensis]